MRYGQRIRVARGAITQARLSEISGVSQSLISQLENSETATGSEYTNRLARALEISADWLADEIGEMKPDLYQTADKKLIAMCRAMEDRAEYVKDAAVTAVLTTRELAERARENGGNSGTHG
jgi:transcriptional regulator with XRE-family HTH domain